MTQNITARHGAVNLTSSQDSVTVQGDLFGSSGVNIAASGNVAVRDITADVGAVSLSSSTGAIAATGTVTTSGGYVDIESLGDIATRNILSGHGSVSIVSSQGAIAAHGDITTNGGYVDIASLGDIATRNVQTSSGGIALTSGGAVTVGFLDSAGSDTGGVVDVQAAGLFRAIDALLLNGNHYSIYTGGGYITIEYRGSSAHPGVAFTVGDASSNGTAAAISTGTDTISALKSFWGSTHLGDIDLLAKDVAPRPAVTGLAASTSSDSHLKELSSSQGTQPDSNSNQTVTSPTVIIGIDKSFWPEQIHLSANQQQQLEGFIKQLWYASRPLAEFVLGAMYQLLYDNGAPVRELLQPLQLNQKEQALWERTLPQSRAFKLGQTLGGGAAIVQGIAEFIGGSGTEVGGGSLCITGIGCLFGAPAVAAGAILQAHGATLTAVSASEEGKLLRELLSPAYLESTTGGGNEQLARELGVSPGQIEHGLGALSPRKIRQLHEQLGQELFGQLLNKDPQVIHDVSRELNLVGDDKVASDAVAETLRLNKKGTISNDDLKNAISKLVNFTEHYQGKVFGDFASRFARAESKILENKNQSQVFQAQGEIKLAEDFLEGSTPLGSRSQVQVKGLPESKIDSVETPEFRVTGADGVDRLAEFKTIQEPLAKNGIKNNLKKAISQIKFQAQKTGETGAYIRIDASSSPSITLSRDEISRFVKGQLLDPTQKGMNYVEFVEVLYNDAADQAQRLLFTVQNGNVVISP